MTLHRTIVKWAMHLFVGVHCVTLEYFYELQGYDEADRDVCAVQDEV